MDKFLTVAALSNEDVTKIRELEEATGTHIMAFEPGLEIATLSKEDLQRIQELEGELNATLLVFVPA
ncbi:MAG: hypothetical protein P8169_13765 [Chloroflexota bacterium]